MVVLRPPLSRGKRRRAQGSLELHAPISLIVFPANAGIQGPPSSGWQPDGHQTTTASAARRVPSFEKNPEHRASGKPAALSSAPWQRGHRGSWAPAFAGETKGARTCALRRWNPRCAEVCAVIAAQPWLLGPRFPTPSFSRRTPGPRDHQALGGDQKDIGPPRVPRQGVPSRELEPRALGLFAVPGADLADAVALQFGNFEVVGADAQADTGDREGFEVFQQQAAQGVGAAGGQPPAQQSVDRADG